MSRKSLASLLCACVSALGVGGVAADDSPLPNADYGVSTLWQLGGTGTWDYLALDPSGARLFVARGDRVDVVETASGRRSAIIPNTAGVHGIAFAPEFKRGYTSNGRTNSVSAFELDSLRVVQEAPVAGKNPDAILYEPRSKHLLTADADSNDITVMDAQTLQVLASIALPGRPKTMVSDGAGTIFVNIENEPGKLVALDSGTFKVKATWPLPGCAQPTGLAIDTAHHRVFSVCAADVMAVTDATSGHQVARVAIGDGPDVVAYDPDLGFVFSSNGVDGTMTVIHQESADEYRVIATVQTQKNARTMTLDPATHRVFLASGRFGDTSTGSAEHLNPQPTVVPDSFVILVAEPK